MVERPDLICIGCGRPPAEITEYIVSGREENMTPDEFVWAEEGTLNPVNGHFACTRCYISMGMPSTQRGWRAP